MAPKVSSVVEWFEAARAGRRTVECARCGWVGDQFPVHMLTCDPPRARYEYGLTSSSSWMLTRLTSGDIQRWEHRIGWFTVAALVIAGWLFYFGPTILSLDFWPVLIGAGILGLLTHAAAWSLAQQLWRTRENH